MARDNTLFISHSHSIMQSVSQSILGLCVKPRVAEFLFCPDAAQLVQGNHLVAINAKRDTVKIVGLDNLRIETGLNVLFDVFFIESLPDDEWDVGLCTSLKCLYNLTVALQL